MMNEFYCGGCGCHKKLELLSRTTQSKRKVCQSCDAKIAAKEEKRKAPSTYYKDNPNATGLDDEKHAKKVAAKRYRKGRLPGFMYS